MRDRTGYLIWMKYLKTIEYSIKVTPVFKLCLKKLDAFLTRKFNHNVANEAKRAIKSKVKSQLSGNPYSAPHSDRLLELGLTEYRQLLVDSNNVLNVIPVTGNMFTVCLECLTDSEVTGESSGLLARSGESLVYYSGDNSIMNVHGLPGKFGFIDSGGGDNYFLNNEVYINGQKVCSGREYITSGSGIYVNSGEGVEDIESNVTFSPTDSPSYRATGAYFGATGIGGDYTTSPNSEGSMFVSDVSLASEEIWLNGIKQRRGHEYYAVSSGSLLATGLRINRVSSRTSKKSLVDEANNETWQNFSGGGVLYPSGA